MTAWLAQARTERFTSPDLSDFKDVTFEQRGIMQTGRSVSPRAPTT